MNVKEEISKKEIIYLDILKIFACFMVIINHTNGFIMTDKSFSNMTFFCITYSLCKVGVGLFLMITGALVLDKQYSYKKILKCVLRVLVPTFFISLIFYFIDTDIHNLNIILFLKDIISKPYMFSYWYIYAIIGVYLVLPFIQKMVKNFSNRDYLFFIIIFLLLPTLVNFLKLCLNIKIDSNFQLAFFPVFIAFIICGNYIAKIETSKENLALAFIVFIISYISVFAFFYIPYLNSGNISYALDSWEALPIVLMTISLFYIIRYFFENKKYSVTGTKVISTVASATFGIYLLHTKLNTVLFKLSIMKSIFKFNPIIAIIILEVAVFIICMIVVLILKKLLFMILKTKKEK